MKMRITTLTLLNILILLAPGRSAVSQEGEKTVEDTVKEHARTALEVYRSKDVPKFLSLLATPPPQETIATIVPGTASYEQLFGEKSKQWQAVEAWNGELGEVVLDPQAFVVVCKQQSAFGPENPDVYNCIRFKYQDGKWLMDKFYILQQSQIDRPTFPEVPADSTLNQELNQMAATLIRAYQQQDTETIKALSVAEGPWALRGESDKSEAERLYSPSEMKGVTQWEGNPGRVFTSYIAAVTFGESEKNNQRVQLVNVGGPWKLLDIKVTSK